MFYFRVGDPPFEPTPLVKGDSRLRIDSLIYFARIIPISARRTMLFHLLHEKQNEGIIRLFEFS